MTTTETIEYACHLLGIAALFEGSSSVVLQLSAATWRRVGLEMLDRLEEAGLLEVDG